MTSRGIRNNNPGNIRRSNDDWQGLSVAQTDDAFFTFTEAKWGIRAMAKILLNYQRKKNINDLAHMIARWAPGNENNTQAYIMRVAKRMDVSPFAVLPLAQNTPLFVRLIKAMIEVENRQPGVDWKDPYTDEQVMEAIAAI